MCIYIYIGFYGWWLHFLFTLNETNKEGFPVVVGDPSSPPLPGLGFHAFKQTGQFGGAKNVGKIKEQMDQYGWNMLEDRNILPISKKCLKYPTQFGLNNQDVNIHDTYNVQHHSTTMISGIVQTWCIFQSCQIMATEDGNIDQSPTQICG